MLGYLSYVHTVFTTTGVCCIVMILVTGADAFACKFPNEGCRVNKECCSGKCVDAHPGTNPRCTRLSLHDPCLYTYQCDDRLRCGTNNTCCSKYWGTCTKKADCCDPQHSCYEVEGFYYKRCLYANNGCGVSVWIGRLSPLLVTLVVSLSCVLTTGHGLRVQIHDGCEDTDNEWGVCGCRDDGDDENSDVKGVDGDYDCDHTSGVSGCGCNVCGSSWVSKFLDRDFEVNDKRDESIFL